MRSRVVHQVALRVIALFGLVAGVGVVITSEGLTLGAGGPLPAQAQPVIMADAGVETEASLEPAAQPAGFVKASAADLEDMKALAKLQAAARRAAEVQPDQAPATAAAPLPLALAEAPSPEPGPPASDSGVGSFETAPFAAGGTIGAFGDVSAGNGPATDAAVAADPLSAGDAVAMLPRLPMPRPKPPASPVRKASSGAVSSPPNCGSKHAYWHNVNRRKVWYCR